MGNYVQPVPPGTKVMRKDQGQDYQGRPGDHVVAIGNAHVDAVKSDPNGFGTAIYYTLLDGPAKGQQIYVGHAQSVVKPGQVVQVGQPVAVLTKNSGGNAKGLSGWTEVGLAHNGAPMYSDAVGGDHFQALLKGSGYIDQSPQTPPVSSMEASGSPQAPPVDGRQVPNFQGGGMPDYNPPSLNQPSLANAPPVSQLWQQIASQPFASPETVAWANNVGGLSAGSSG